MTCNDSTTFPDDPTALDDRYVYDEEENLWTRRTDLPDGNHVETSLWRILQRPTGWRTGTYYVTEGDDGHTLDVDGPGVLGQIIASANNQHVAGVRRFSKGEAVTFEEPNAAGAACITTTVFQRLEEFPAAMSTPLVSPLPAPSEEVYHLAEGLQTYDAVENPHHYQAGRFGAEAIDLLRHTTYEGGNALKYVIRHEDKGKPVEDLRKAIVYTQWLVDHDVPVIIPSREEEFYLVWRHHFQPRIPALPEVYRALMYVVGKRPASAIHLINRRIEELGQ